MIGDSFTDISRLFYGVKQGSVLGPDLFGIYIRSLYPLIQPCKFDTASKPDWMQEYFLCLNVSKTKILILKPTTLKEEISNRRNVH